MTHQPEGWNGKRIMRVDRETTRQSTHEENDMNRNVGISLGGLILLLIIVAILF